MKSIYELPAEKKNYYLFEKKKITKELVHFHSSIELIIIIQGKVEVTIDGVTRILSSNEGAIVDSFNVHFYKGSEDSLVYVLLGDKKYFEEFFYLINNKIPNTFLKFNNLEYIDFLYNEFNKSQEYKTIQFAGIINLILRELILINKLLERKIENLDTSLICKILKYVDEHYNEDLTIKKISKEFGYSKEYLSRLLHRYLNENWNDYINRKRILIFNEKYKDNSKLNILEIAYECGFTSQSTFYRAYKKENMNLPKNK